MESVAIRTSSLDSADIVLMFSDSEYTDDDLMSSDSGRNTTDPTSASSEQEENIPTEKPKKRKKKKGICAFLRRIGKAVKLPTLGCSEVDIVSTFPSCDPTDVQQDLSGFDWVSPVDPCPSGVELLKTVSDISSLQLPVNADPDDPEPSSVSGSSVLDPESAPDLELMSFSGLSSLSSIELTPDSSQDDLDPSSVPGPSAPDSEIPDPSGLETAFAFDWFAENRSKKKKAVGAFLRRKWRAIKRSVRFASDWFADEPVDNQDPADLRPALNSLGCMTLNSNNQTDPEPLSVSSPSTLDSGIAPAVEKQSKRRVKTDISSFIQRTWKTIKVSTLCCYGDDTVDPDPTDLQPRISLLFRELTDPGPSYCEISSDPLAFSGPSHCEISSDPLAFSGPSYCGSQSDSLSLDSSLDPSLSDLLSELSVILGPSSHEVTPVPSSSSLKLADPEPKPVQGASGLWSATGEFSSFYEVKAVLGTGGFGTVCEGTRRCDGQKVAIKFRPKKYWEKFTNLPGSTKPLLMEVAVNLLMRKAPKSPHIVQMLDWFAEPEQFVLIMEYPHLCETLLKFTQRNGGSLDEAVARGLMRQAVLAAKHCVDQGVFHKDIKADNILVNTETLQLAFIDFSCCELFKTCKGRDWAVKSTVWSLGIVLLEIASGSQPLINLQTGKLDPLRPTLSKECSDLIKQCLDNHQSKRPTLEQMLEHAWFEQD